MTGGRHVTIFPDLMLGHQRRVHTVVHKSRVATKQTRVATEQPKIMGNGFRQTCCTSTGRHALSPEKNSEQHLQRARSTETRWSKRQTFCKKRVRHTLPICPDLPNLNSLTSKPSVLAGKEAFKEYAVAQAELNQLQEAEAAAAAEAFAIGQAEAGDAEEAAEGESLHTPRPVVAKLLALRGEIDNWSDKAVRSKSKLDAISAAREKVRSSPFLSPPPPASNLIAVLLDAGITSRR